MKVDVLYGLITNAVFINVYCHPENEYDESIQEKFNNDVVNELKKKINGTLDDDDLLYGALYDETTKEHIERIIKRVVKTKTMEYNLNFAVYIEEIKENEKLKIDGIKNNG